MLLKNLPPDQLHVYDHFYHAEAYIHDLKIQKSCKTCYFKIIESSNDRPLQKSSK